MANTPPDKSSDSNKALLRGLDASITRRDLVNGVLVGAGTSLLLPGCTRQSDSPAPAAGSMPGVAAPSGAPLSPWTGYGGVGDYANSNGNTEAVIKAAHKIRDGDYEALDAHSAGGDEQYDLVVIGAGFAGLSAAYEAMRTRGTALKCLVLDNHPIFGGEAKQNEFVVDGHRLHGPQGSNDFSVPEPGSDFHGLWKELGLPEHFDFAAPPAQAPRAALDNFGPMFWEPEHTPVGFFFRGAHEPRGRWIIDAWRDGFAHAPISAHLRHDLDKLWNLRERPYQAEDFKTWLDGMTYKSFLVDVLGLDPAVTAYVDPLLATGDYGFGSDVISAFAAYKAWLPGVRSFHPPEAVQANSSASQLLSFPGGNAAIVRHMVKKLLPDSIEGTARFEDVLEQRVDFNALDRPGSWLRIRQSATAVRIAHEGGPHNAEHVSIVYAHNERLHRVRAKAVVMAGGGWVARRIMRDLPENLRMAYGEFHHGPILVANVALRNWRFLDKLGFTSARWFEGFGFFANIRRPMTVGGKSAPFSPDKPVVMTFYVPFLHPGNDIRTQGILARNELLSKSYRDFELQIRDHMSLLFSSAGFDAARDIAGIVLNRWGHAYIAPQPGFTLGRNGVPSPLEVVKQGYGRIFFGHSELSGTQNWVSAVTEGSRAARQALALI